MIKTLSCWHYIFALTFISTMSCLSCTSPQGTEVSWFAAMKFPQKFLSSHAYLDNTGGSEFTIINNPIDDATALSALVRTMEKIKLVKNILAFNDDGAGTNGHMKGIIGYDEQSGTGVYIMHSIPKYPIIINGNIDTSLPPNAFANAQHVYCISLGTKVLGEVVDNIRYAKPHIKMRTGLFLNFIRVSSKLIKATSFPLLSGETQYFFTKSPSNYAHIYDDIVGPGLGTSLIINTFLPGRSPPLSDQDADPLSASSALSAPLALPAFSVLPGLDDLDLDLLLDPDIGLSSICGRRSFRNNVSIRFGDNHFWTFGSDHSKWAVSPDYERVKIACFCDLNRVCSQAKRGGSCLCLESPKLHAALLRTVEAPENCKKKFNNYGCPNPPKPSKPAAANIKFHPYLKK